MKRINDLLSIILKLLAIFVLIIVILGFAYFYIIKPKIQENASRQSETQEMIDPVDFEVKNELGETIINVHDVLCAETATRTDTTTRKYVINITLNTEGTVKFSEATTSAYKNKESVYIYIDGGLFSSPKVNEPITGGQFEINGFESYKEASDLALRISVSI